jgi:hypothetical protein
MNSFYIKGGYRKKAHNSSEVWIAENVISGIEHFGYRKSQTYEK